MLKQSITFALAAMAALVMVQPRAFAQSNTIQASPPAAQEQVQPQASPALPPEPVDPDAFRVGNIRIEGLQRISEGTVYNYLPVNIGDVLDEQRLREALRAIYATGFFRDAELRRDGDTLVVAVLERPSIESFEIEGNKDIKTEDLTQNLRQAGLAAGKTFDRSVLDEVTRYLTDQYFSRGKYGVRIDTDVTEVPGNKVKIAVNIREGKRAKIRQINIVGNKQFKDKELLGEFELKTPNWLSWYKQGDRYARESLQGDLEKLRSFYMDRGYANFRVESTQVAIAPEKDDIFVTINIDEGEVYKVSEVKLAGNLVVPEEELRKMILVQPGQTFSNKLVTTSQEYLSYRLGTDGYAFAEIDPVPTPNEETKEVSLTFFIEPGNRVYVRHVNFLGTDSINDETLRREMRQLEGAYLSNQAVERSKERLQRLAYIKSVETETTPVPGSPDLVDVDVSIEEGLPGQFSGGIGYSESYKFLLNGSFVHSNYRGRGERVALELQTGRFSKVYSFQHTNPYTSIDGVSRSTSFAYRDVTQFVSASSDFSTKQLSAGLTYGYPISEYQGMRLGFSLQRAELLTSASGSASQAVDWVRQNGDTFVRIGNFGGLPVQFFGTRFNALELTGGWAYDSRVPFLFPMRGMQHSIDLSYTVPGSDVEYWNVSYDYSQYLPLWRNFILATKVEIGYGRALGDTTAVPPYRNFFGGGPNSVRGFEESRLGPKDNFGNPYGGNLKVIGRVELLFPLPRKWQSSARVGLFYDVGNIFYQGGGVQFTDRAGFPVDLSFDVEELRSSAGIGVQWLAPLGLFRFSYAIPLKYRKGTELNYGDQLEGFQFSIGQAF